MTLSHEEAKKQLEAEFKSAGVGVEIIADINSIILDQLISKVKLLGVNEDSDKSTCDTVMKSVEMLFDKTKKNEQLNELLFPKDQKKLWPHAQKICEIIENTAPTPASKEALKKAFEPIKEKYLKSKEAKEFGKSLSKLQETITGLRKNQEVRNMMGDYNADKFAAMTKKMEEESNRYDRTGDKAKIIKKHIKQMQEFLGNAEKEASKGDFGKLMNVLKSALKVIGTLGLSKQAKLELSNSKFVLDNKNIATIKAGVKVFSKELEKSAQVIKIHQPKKQNTGRSI
jgi:hypothetical protein